MFSFHAAENWPYAILINDDPYRSIPSLQVNPAVSAGFVVVGDLSPFLFLFYVVAQICGATFGAGIARALVSDELYTHGQGGLLIIRDQVRDGKSTR